MSELKCGVPKYHSQVWEDSGSGDIGVQSSRPIRIQDSSIYCTVQTAPNFSTLSVRIDHMSIQNTPSLGVHDALMESMARIYLICVPNNFLDVIICTHIYRIICQLARVFNNQTIR